MGRNNSIDSIKGILIILVVIGHVPAPKDLKLIYIFSEWIYIFHMPAFFIVSGIFIKSLRQTVTSSLPLLVCYIFWFLISNRRSTTIVQDFLFSNFDALKGILWFLPCIITYKIILSIILSPKVPIFCRAFCVSAGVIVAWKHGEIQQVHYMVPWGLDIALFLIPITIISRYIYFNLPFKFFPACAMKSTLTFCAFIFFVFSLLFYARVPLNTTTEYWHKLDLAQFSTPGFEGYFYLLVMMIAIVGVAKTNIPENFLSSIGRKTLPIFLFHLYAISAANIFLFSVSGVFSYVLMIAFAIFFSLMLSKILLKISNLFRFVGA